MKGPDPVAPIPVVAELDGGCHGQSESGLPQGILEQQVLLYLRAALRAETVEGFELVERSD